MSSNLQFEEPPVDSLSKDDRAGSGGSLGLDVGAVERMLKASPGRWAKVYGTEDVPGATKSVVGRWDKKAGFETKRKLIESSRIRADGSKRQPSGYKYEIWIRFTGEVTEEQAEAGNEAYRRNGGQLQETSIPAPRPTPPAPTMPSAPVIHSPRVPTLPQAPDAESEPTIPPAQAERYQRPDPIANGTAEFA